MSNSVSVGNSRTSADEGHGRVLVVEDEIEIRNLIVLHLKRQGLTVDEAGSAEEAQPLMQTHLYALLILDWMLPGESGIEIARFMRRSFKSQETAILMVTARAEAADIVAGLEAGADDFLTKPFEPTVLIARVRALLRRSRKPQMHETEGGALRVGELVVYLDEFRVLCGESPVQLTTSEFKLLQALLENRGRVLTRDSLISQVQGENVSVVGRTVDTHVFGLRKKLGSCAEIIETVRGVGYRVKPSLEG